MSDLIEWLRLTGYGTTDEAADLIEAQAAELTRLRADNARLSELVEKT